MDKTKVRAEFSICGDSLDLNKVTKKLNLEPTATTVKDVIPEGGKRPSRETSWTISTEKEESYDIDEQTRKLLSRIKNKVEELCEIKETMNTAFYLQFLVEVENGEKPALYYTSDTIKFLASIGAETDIDLYIYS